MAKLLVNNKPSKVNDLRKVKSDMDEETPGKRIRHWISCGIPLLLTVQLAEGLKRLGSGIEYARWGGYQYCKYIMKYIEIV